MNPEAELRRAPLAPLAGAAAWIDVRQETFVTIPRFGDSLSMPKLARLSSPAPATFALASASPRVGDTCTVIGSGRGELDGGLPGPKGVQRAGDMRSASECGIA